MTRDEIQNHIIEMMVATFEIERDKITLASRLYEDLELDSIDALDMVVKLQELTHRRIEEEELRSLRTIGDVVDMVINTQQAEQQAG